MTLLAWLESRTPAPPAAMFARVVEALGTRAGEDASRASVLCLEAATELLERLLAPDALGREWAIDLLAVDALVTYAFEAAAGDIAQLDERAASAMVRLGALAAERRPSDG
jgi:hypothetical protein